MNQIEIAELELRRAQDRYKAAIEQEKAGVPPAPPIGREASANVPPMPLPNQVKLDIEKITTVEDMVAIMKNMQVVMMVDRNHPEFTAVEHLIVDEEDEPESTETPQ